MNPGRGLLVALAALAVASSCTRMKAPGLPPPARPGVLVPMSYEQAFAALNSLVESRGMPVLVADANFGNIRTDWIYYDPGEIDLRALADCHRNDDAPPAPVRIRYAFEVRKRANRATVTIFTQYQIEAHRGFDGSDRGYAECDSTGEWERAVEQSLTQRTIH